VFTSFDAGVGNLSWRAWDGSTPLERIAEGPNSRYATAITADGTQLIFREEAGERGLDIAMLPLEGDRRSTPLIDTQYTELNAELSPDGRWMVYRSNQSGKNEVYVRPFPNVDAGFWQISTAGGRHPAWARSGRELFYCEPNGALMGVPVELQPRFAAGTPTKILEGVYFRGVHGRAYDVSPDGERFLMIKEDESSGHASSPQSIVVIFNWFEELKRLVPTGN
jgi:serine/threonine-protein kinase